MPLPDEREWLVTNGLGGYACGTVSGELTRRFHGLLIAALPRGRVMMLQRLVEQELAPRAWRLEGGVPVWRFESGASVLEKRVRLVHGQNTVHVTYTLLEGPPVALKLRPELRMRVHDGRLDGAPAPLRVELVAGGHELAGDSSLPTLRMHVDGAAYAFCIDPVETARHVYAVERARDYDAEGSLDSPGTIEVVLETTLTVVASTEPWDTPVTERAPAPTPLARAADQFVVTPAARAAERSVIAGYPWFADWGRDTMISLEGLTLVTGRHAEAAAILRAFAGHVRDGLVPNLFPDGQRQGLYHTADASLWFVHAVSRTVHHTGDRALLAELLPTLGDILDAHLAGTRFGIRVDPTDGLLHQGEAGYQLTWMDAKLGDWVVTPRRGKAVEINALFYNALCVVAAWLPDGTRYRVAAERLRQSFQRRFWYEAGQHLYDVVDGEAGDDASCRPNQLLAISLPHAVLDRARWRPVFDVCRRELLTPVGLRSLSPRDAAYVPRYEGDLAARDAAYHQGTVWAWLIGPYVDAWRKLEPTADHASALTGLLTHLDAEGCVGSISEIFDAEPPHTPRGCFAQAWSVAEVLRVSALGLGAGWSSAGD